MTQNNFDMNAIKQWIAENPQDAKNIEDLFNWCCDHFEVPVEKMKDVFEMCKKIQNTLS